MKKIYWYDKYFLESKWTRKKLNQITYLFSQKYVVPIKVYGGELIIYIPFIIY